MKIKGLCILLLMLGINGLAKAESLDYLKLVQVICHQRESQGIPANIEPISPNRLDWGRCQINVDTAMWMGYGTSKKSFALLWNNQGSENAALELTVRIGMILDKKNLPRNVYNMSFRFNCGPNSSPGWLKKHNIEKYNACNEYAQDIVQKYNSYVVMK